MNDNSTYTGFVEWMKQSWYGLPRDENALPFIMARYTPEEAALFTGMPFTAKPVDELARLKGMDPAVLAGLLDVMARRGLVYRLERNGTALYAFNDIFMEIRTFGWPGRVDEESRKVAEKANDYWENGFLDPWMRTSHTGLRVIPINKTVGDPRTVMPYEDVKEILDRITYFTVTTCPCRHIKNLDPRHPASKYPMEVCLHFDELGRYIVDNGLGREITRTETEKILADCADAGLVHSISNQQEKPDTICNCDREYCMWFTLRQKLGHSMGHVPSRYIAKINRDTCLGCGTCVKRCPMQAITLAGNPDARNKTGKTAEIREELCIGCGVCAHKCTSGSITLAMRHDPQEPPMTVKDFLKATWIDFRK